MTTLRILVVGLLGASALALLTASGSVAASCRPPHVPTGHAFVSYSDPDDPRSWRDHRIKVEPGELRDLCAAGTSTHGAGPTAQGNERQAAHWALVGGAGAVAAGSVLIALRRRPG